MFLDYCYRWIDKHNTVLNTVLAFAGVVATIFAFRIARRIFRDGLRVDRDKILDEFALELVTEFIIPFQDLKSAFKPIRDGLGNTVEDSDVNLNSMLTVIQGSMFQAKFPYYESHKGDIWDSLQKNNKDKLIHRFYRYVVLGFILNQTDPDGDDVQVYDYKKIATFVDDAESFCEGLKVTQDALYKYINGIVIEEDGTAKPKTEIKAARANDTVAKFYENANVAEKKFLINGLVLMEQLDREINELPKRLHIGNMKSRFSR